MTHEVAIGSRLELEGCPADTGSEEDELGCPGIAHHHHGHHEHGADVGKELDIPAEPAVEDHEDYGVDYQESDPHSGAVGPPAEPVSSTHSSEDQDAVEHVHGAEGHGGELIQGKVLPQEHSTHQNADQGDGLLALDDAQRDHEGRGDEPET